MKRLAAQSVPVLILLLLCLVTPAPAEEEGDDPGRAADFFLFKRSSDGDTFPIDKYVDALEHMKAMPRHVTPSGQTVSPSGAAAAAPAAALQTWTPLGPGNIGGRTRALLVDPLDPQTMYAAGVAGGVWKTTDGGASWRPMSDLLPSIAVVSMAMDPGNRSVIYAGTGEFFTGDGIRGGGIFKTTDAAVTWTRLGATDNPDFYYVNRMVVSSSNPARLYAATSTGVFRSVDGGATWQKILDDTHGGCMELVIRTDVPNDYLFAACGPFGTGMVWRATSGATVAPGGWEPVLAEPGMARTSLAIAPSDQRVVYALAAHEGSEFNSAVHAIFRSGASGDPGSWVATVRQTADSDPIGRSILSDNVLAMPGCVINDQRFWRNQGWWDNAITVDPRDPDRVWAGGINLFRSDDGGRTWGIASYWFENGHLFVHADHHRIVFHPQYDGAGNQTLFVANDGGVYRTLNARASIGTCAAPFNGAIAWSDLDHGYAVTQFYHGVPFPDGTRYIGGTQDNGTLIGRDSDGPERWQRLAGGDGGYVAVNPVNPNVFYYSVNGFVYRTTDGGRSVTPVDPPLAYRLFVFPLVMDLNAPSRLWVGGDRVVRTDDAGSSWTTAMAPLSTGDVIASLAVAPSDSNRVLAATAFGEIFRTTSALTDSSAVWASAQLPGFGFVSSVAFDPHDPTIAYATMSSFGTTHVWRSADGGATWSPIDGSGTTGLPDVPVHVLVVDPTDTARLYIGTDVGVFASTDGGASWAVELTGFAAAPTEALSITMVAGVPHVFAFTHGRGAWRVATGTGAALPTISALSPARAAKGGPPFTLTVTGSNFVSGATVTWNGAARPTTFVSATELTASIATADLAAAGPLQVTVRNPDGRFSNAATFTVMPCPAGQFFAEYFANVTLTPPAARTACESVVNYVYGAGGPAGLPVDNFSVRWTGRFTFAGGSVTFTARADDGVRVFLDGANVIDGWRDQPASTYTTMIPVTAGEHEVRVEYYDRLEDAVIQVSWTGSAPPPPPSLTTLSPTSAAAGGPAFTLTADGANFVSGATLLWNGAARTTTFVSATRLMAAIPAADIAAAGSASVTVRNPDGQSSGARTFTITAGPGCPTGQFLAEYFANVGLTGTPARTACETTITNSYGAGGPAGLPVDNFSVRWTGRFPFAAGSSTFTARADDGVRVFVDGVVLIDQWKDQPATTYTASRTLTAGDHDVKVEYYERGGDAVIQVSWTGAPPPPVLSTLTPSTTPAGSPSFTLTADGSNFVAGATLLWNGGARTTTFVSATRVTAAITAADVATTGSASVAVRNPNGQGSGALTFTITPAGGGCPTGQFFAEYFANVALTGAPARTACETTINNTYGAGGPAGLPVDNFSARWTGRFTFAAGTFTFTARADDGVRLLVDGTLIIDGWRDQPATTYTATRTLTAGDHEVKVEYYERGGGAVVQVSWTGGGTSAPTLSTLTPSTATAGSPAFTLTADGANFVSGAIVLWNGAVRTTTFVSTTRLMVAIPATDVAAAGSAFVTVRNPDGLTSNALTFTVSAGGGCPAGQFVAEYFANVGLTGTPARTACETTINNSYGAGGPAGLPVDNFSVRWTGRFPFAAGSSTFTARADDGVRVFVDGVVLIDQWKDQPATTYSASRTLTAGDHEVKVEYYERGGDAVIQVSWTGGTSAPALGTLTPSTTTAGSPAFTLTADGSGFVSGATVLWNGAARATTFVSSTRLTAAIPAGDVAAPGSASATVRNPDGQTSGAQTFTITPAGGGCATGQFLAEYFGNVALTGTPTRTACESTINNDYGASGPAGLPADNFSARWTGRFTFAAGSYTFTARADDGVRVFVDAVAIIDQWHDGGATTYTATRTLTAGDHEVKVEYYERFGAAVIQASWAAAP